MMSTAESRQYCYSTCTSFYSLTRMLEDGLCCSMLMHAPWYSCWHVWHYYWCMYYGKTTVVELWFKHGSAVVEVW